jgi:protein tyrosine/serine phosphatase
VTTILQFLVDTSRLPIYVHCLDGTVVTYLAIACLRKLHCWSLPSILIECSRSTSDNSPPSSDEVEFIEKFQTEMEIGRQSWVWPMMSEFKRHPTLKIKLEGEPAAPISNMTSFTESIAGKMLKKEGTETEDVDEEVFSLTLRALDLEMSFSRPNSAM